MGFVMSAQDETELTARVKTVAASLGFDTFLLGIEVSRPLLKPLQHAVSCYPEQWQRIYGEREYLKKDPTVAHCQSKASPLIWEESMYSEGSRDLWEESRSFGLIYGVSIPVHERQGVKSMISLARDKPIDSDPRELESLLNGARVLANCAHSAMGRIVVPKMMENRDPKLSMRERECLLWAARGKTAAEIGLILNIAESTAVFHLKNVLKKFDVVNRTQAIAMGVSLGMID
jgi:DNA-binding CsgD family transcriptional regulator